MNKLSKNAQIAAVLIFTVIFLTGCANKTFNSLVQEQEKLKKADVIVVLGFGPPVDKDGKPNIEIVNRVTAGVDLYNQGLAKNIIMTGGNTYKDYYESSVMKDVAISMGVPKDSVIEEREARDTIGNARYTKVIMEKNGWKSCIIVSSPYHLKRAQNLFGATGLDVQTYGADTPGTLSYAFTATVYEYLVRVYYLFIDEKSLVINENS
jgi:uncharacterized SAM-binding protein YcdF (DUF218 family)